MPTDRYTKLVLTVIAGALVALVVQNAIAPAQAQLGSGACGSSHIPCYVTTGARDWVNTMPYAPARGALPAPCWPTGTC